MTYAAVDTAMLAARTGGDILGQIGVGLLKQAAVRALAIGNIDSKEAAVCRTILEGHDPTTWTKIVLEVLDINGTLGTHTDAQVDTAIGTAWTYILASRSIT